MIFNRFYTGNKQKEEKKDEIGDLKLEAQQVKEFDFFDHMADMEKQEGMCIWWKRIQENPIKSSVRRIQYKKQDY